jgi:hypothetical protein
VYSARQDEEYNVDIYNKTVTNMEISNVTPHYDPYSIGEWYSKANYFNPELTDTLTSSGVGDNTIYSFDIPLYFYPAVFGSYIGLRPIANIPRQCAYAIDDWFFNRCIHNSVFLLDYAHTGDRFNLGVSISGSWQNMVNAETTSPSQRYYNRIISLIGKLKTPLGDLLINEIRQAENLDLSGTVTQLAYTYSAKKYESPSERYVAQIFPVLSVTGQRVRIEREYSEPDPEYYSDDYMFSVVPDAPYKTEIIGQCRDMFGVSDYNGAGRSEWFEQKANEFFAWYMSQFAYGDLGYDEIPMSGTKNPVTGNSSAGATAYIQTPSGTTYYYGNVAAGFDKVRLSWLKF